MALLSHRTTWTTTKLREAWLKKFSLQTKTGLVTSCTKIWIETHLATSYRPFGTVNCNYCSDWWMDQAHLHRQQRNSFQSLCISRDQVNPHRSTHRMQHLACTKQVRIRRSRWKVYVYAYRVQLALPYKSHKLINAMRHFVYSIWRWFDMLGLVIHHPWISVIILPWP